jgi:hypothetical protein
VNFLTPLQLWQESKLRRFHGKRLLPTGPAVALRRKPTSECESPLININVPLSATGADERSLAVTFSYLTMSIEFGWWANRPETGKFQINVEIHGGNIVWKRKQGHHNSWEKYGPPTDEDWDKLIYEAERRVPRRLISPKQFEDIKSLRAR